MLIAIVDRRGRPGVERAFESAAAVTGIEAADAAASLPPDGAPTAAGSGTLGWGRAAIGGLVTVAAYMLVLVAYVYAPLSVVAPVRESAIVLVSGWGSFRLGEAATRRVGLSRLAAAAVIVVGASCWPSRADGDPSPRDQAWGEASTPGSGAARGRTGGARRVGCSPGRPRRG